MVQAVTVLLEVVRGYGPHTMWQWAWNTTKCLIINAMQGQANARHCQ